MDPPRTPRVPPAPAPALTLEERRWLHDKYERLAAEEGSLSASRTSYYAAIGTVILTGLIIALDDFGTQPAILIVVVSFLAGLGLMISSVWTVLLHRTTDAQNLWREAARYLEECAPPVEGTLLAPVTLRSGERLEIDLLQPYHAHQTRFSGDRRISWMDRVDPSALTETLPLAFLVLWSTVLVGAWIWFLVVR